MQKATECLRDGWPVVRWFINEAGDVYPSYWSVEKLRQEFPDDNHTPYSTEAEALAYRELFRLRLSEEY